jgi:hypothetical protein
MSLLQLDPPLPVASVAGRKGLAHLVIDYGVEHNLVWVVAWDDNRELWCVPNSQLRVQENITFGRPKEVQRASETG